MKKTIATGLQAEPKSMPPLGAQLRQIREEIVASGEPLLDWEGIEREKAERRGENREYAE